MMKGKRKREKKEKKGKKEEKRGGSEKKRGRLNMILLLTVEKRHVFPQSVRYLLKGKNIIEKISFWKGGGGRILFLGKIYTPVICK